MQGYVKHLQNWPALCLKFQKTFNAAELPTEYQKAASGGQRLLGYIEEHIATSVRSKIICNLLVAASHLSFITVSQFDADTLPDLPDFINNERIKYVFVFFAVLFVNK